MGMNLASAVVPEVRANISSFVSGPNSAVNSPRFSRSMYGSVVFVGRQRHLAAEIGHGADPGETVRAAEVAVGMTPELAEEHLVLHLARAPCRPGNAAPRAGGTKDRRDGGSWEKPPCELVSRPRLRKPFEERLPILLDFINGSERGLEGGERLAAARWSCAPPSRPGTA